MSPESFYLTFGTHFYFNTALFYQQYAHLLFVINIFEIIGATISISHINDIDGVVGVKRVCKIRNISICTVFVCDFTH